jgi:probable phosphoglycerate mutase
MRIYIFARHAESAANVARAINSDPSRPVGLTPCGERQATLLGRQLAHLHIDQAVCTRFLRTRQTAELALRDTGVPILVEPDLDEVDAGSLDGVPIATYWAWKERHDRHERFPGGESLDEAVQRYASAVRRLLDRDARVTLIVCHELALRLLAGSSFEIANAVPDLFDERSLRRAVERVEVTRAAA